ncbi:(d)CMP kinase [Bradymonadaceae bacterium TMQ3]|uniref:Cytidylate kinase n=1 Tax=Lujinxingia sediminis TaxID=2480984 RepID=A0ABY0CT44_9DELT|nr:(d)CMP kinase [Lujinxingia sediminis]RDV38891.1 (d)CMP kinase [Bradymonadaceae bacterium TMQ3]RVU44125.1 (d)CMP kinase [Lujinxingia sediminis]TXC76337.1 (d)CMP kinase [Bradymonadales bacterium TMQ1]
MIVAIDGPAGAGKSTIARALAEKLGFQLVDTGAMYRAVAYEAAAAGVDLQDAEQVADIARGLRFEFKLEGGENVIYCNTRALNQEIRSAEVSRNASVISAHPAVRRELVDQQRQVGRERSSVLEGRDIGTVVFPDAELKVFITASPAVRARRRVEQMREGGDEVDEAEVLRDIIERDRRDSERDVAPLKKAEDAIGIDSTDVSVEEIVAGLCERVAALR